MVVALGQKSDITAEDEKTCELYQRSVRRLVNFPLLNSRTLKVCRTRYKKAKPPEDRFTNRFPNFWAIRKKLISNNTKCRKQILKLIWNTWKYCWNQTDGEIVPVLAQFFGTFSYFSWVPIGNCFRCYLKQLHISLLCVTCDVINLNVTRCSW